MKVSTEIMKHLGLLAYVPLASLDRGIVRDGTGRMRKIIAFGFLLAAITVGHGAFAQIPTAKDEASPALRDAPIVALTSVRIIDGTGTPAREDQTLVIEAGKIRAVGTREEIEVPEHAHILDLEGRTVLPGLIMLHEHLFYESPAAGDSLAIVPGTHPQHFSFPRLYHAAGVTKRRIDAGERTAREASKPAKKRTC